MGIRCLICLIVLNSVQSFAIKPDCGKTLSQKGLRIYTPKFSEAEQKLIDWVPGEKRHGEADQQWIRREMADRKWKLKDLRQAHKSIDRHWKHIRNVLDGKRTELKLGPRESLKTVLRENAPKAWKNVPFDIFAERPIDALSVHCPWIKPEFVQLLKIVGIRKISEFTQILSSSNTRKDFKRKVSALHRNILRDGRIPSGSLPNKKAERRLMNLLLDTLLNLSRSYPEIDSLSSAKSKSKKRRLRVAK